MAITALHAAASGMRALDEKLNVVANNLANINTQGFKRSRVNFEDFPLCALAPHFHLSANLRSFLRRERYHYAGPGKVAAEPDALLSRERVLGRACRECAVNMLCRGVDPFYLEQVDTESHFEPLQSDPVALLGQCARFSQECGQHVRPYALQHPEDLVEYLAFGLERVL